MLILHLSLMDQEFIWGNNKIPLIEIVSGNNDSNFDLSIKSSCIVIAILLIYFQCYILYSEQYFSLTIDMITTALQLISVWKKVPLFILLYYLLLTAGYSITLISIKLFITDSYCVMTTFISRFLYSNGNYFN